ncbi:MAG: c-type cytochrome [Terriglobia bacterium]
MVRAKAEPVLQVPATRVESLRFALRIGVFASIAVLSLISLASGQNVPGAGQNRVAQSPGTIRRKGGSTVQSSLSASSPAFPPALVERGGSLFIQHCAFCHGRDAEGGESGPDLTRSKLVAGDVNGNNIAPVVRNGRPSKGMPAFNLSEMQIDALVAFIHTQKTKAEAQEGGRRGVDDADLQTGDAKTGKKYFNGAGRCSSCHSPAGDLAGIALRYHGLKLEERMLYPHGARSKVSVTLASGKVVTGTLAYLDEFTVGLRDGAGYYHSWPISRVKYTINSPVEAHVKLLSKYTDADIHNLMAYLQTLH